MCISPIRIRNPNISLRGKKSLQWYVDSHDCESGFINVPCGHCKECITLRQMYLAQRCIMESRNCFTFFTTLTYNNEHLPKISTSSGFTYSYSDISHFQKMVKRLRIHNSFGRPFRYLAVSERGSKGGRPHFHCLWFLPMFDGESFPDGLSLQSRLFSSILSEWRCNVGSDRYPVYEPLCSYAQKFYRGKLYANYDTHFVVPTLTNSGISSVVFYVLKYMLKDDSHSEDIRKALRLNLEYDEYKQIWSLIRNRYVSSRSFGLGFSINRSSIVEYLKKCVSLSDRSKPLPSFFVPDSSVSLPLCKFYRSNSAIYSVADFLTFNQSNLVVDDRSISEFDAIIDDSERISSIIDKDMSLEFNFLFD